MKKLFTILALLIPGIIFAQETKPQLKVRFDEIRNETVAGANTKVRVANAYQELADGMISVYPIAATGTDTYVGSQQGLDSYSGKVYFVTFANNNTGASTLNIGSIGAGNIQKYDGGWVALEADDIVAGKLYKLYHDGTRFQIDLGGGGAIIDAEADGVTKGIATFTANDFNASSGIISIDYTNGQSSSASNKGFLASADWTTLMVGTLTSSSVSTAGGTITLDFQTSSINRSQKVFNGSASFSTPKTIALSNTGNALSFVFNFVITDVAAVLTLPSDFQVYSIDWDGTDWTPPSVGSGVYMMGGTFNSVTSKWEINISGPHAD